MASTEAFITDEMEQIMVKVRERGNIALPGEKQRLRFLKAQLEVLRMEKTDGE